MSTLADLFPIPSPLLSKYVPVKWAGISPESTATLLEVLKENHEKWHIFFNDMGYHNHIPHHVLTLWALGADDAIIQAAYNADSSYQRPAVKPPGAITVTNWSDHLGDRPYYGSYLAFFTEVIKQKGVTAALEEYIFSKGANFEADSLKKDHSKMFDRLLGGLVHPMIHIGFGLEFNLPGIVAEGLAEAAVHSVSAAAHTPPAFFGISSVASRLKSIILSDSTSSGVHVFTILARVLANPELGKIVDKEGDGLYTETANKYGDVLTEYVNDWHVDTTNPQTVARSLEELFWANVLIYGVGGWKAGQQFNADFFHMHLVTSSLFLPSYTAHLNAASQKILLKGYLIMSLTWWISRGRPDLDIKGFFESTSPYPTPTGPLPTPDKDSLPSPTSPKAVTPNPWFPIVETTLVHPDDHLVKIQRALAHYGSLFGTREAGLPDFTGTELPFAETLDGTLFIRVAGLTAKRMGRVREGEEAGQWDRHGFYKA